MLADTYVITEGTIKEPPVSFFKKLKFLGPGFILSASIVGSGELIATTTLGARAGFIAFWIIIVSCLVKVAVQLEFGKRAILTGQTAMRSFNELPGPRPGKGNWAVWTVFILISLKIVQIGGILGGSAIVLQMLFPFLPASLWAFIIALLTSALIYKGYYSVIEKGSLVMIAGFTISTIAAVFMLQFTAFSFSAADVWEGLQFKFPPAIVAVAFGAFGITGVGADEIVAYNYWCIEKGYAAYTGPRNDSPEWRKRARGWIRVMYLDAMIAMIIYTIVTAAFYLLGAAVLHGSVDCSGRKPGNRNTGTDLYAVTRPRRKNSLPGGGILCVILQCIRFAGCLDKNISGYLRSNGMDQFFRYPAKKKISELAGLDHSHDMGDHVSFYQAAGIHDHLRWYHRFGLTFCNCIRGYLFSKARERHFCPRAFFIT